MTLPQTGGMPLSRPAYCLVSPLGVPELNIRQSGLLADA